MRQGGELPQLQGGPAGHSCPHPHRRGRCGPPSRLMGSQALAQGGPSSSRQSDAGQPRKAAASLPEQVALRLRPPQRAAGPSQAQSAGGTGPAPRVGPVGSLHHGHCPPGSGPGQSPVTLAVARNAASSRMPPLPARHSRSHHQAGSPTHKPPEHTVQPATSGPLPALTSRRAPSRPSPSGLPDPRDGGSGRRRASTESTSKIRKHPT